MLDRFPTCDIGIIEPRSIRLSYERTEFVGFGLRRPAGVTSTGRTSPPISSVWAVQATVQTFSNGISIPTKQNAAFLPRVGSNLQQDILPT